MKNKFTTPGENIRKYFEDNPDVHFTETKCETCGQEMLNTQVNYSMRFYGRALCRSCQRLIGYEK